jgi:2-dehydro-3-deoxygluconokinase
MISEKEETMKKYITFGEIMLRLKSPNQERFFQSPLLEATFGGGEANVAVGLARFGLNVAYVSVIPKKAWCRYFIYGEKRRQVRNLFFGSRS